ncbi:penicillin-binding transpeptidase domain-containing protein [Lactobacillus sp. R2/2]|nr:penicillin-binding transpeptidase domain-containing protein [Lactobacillus sp. R2/2]
MRQVLNKRIGTGAAYQMKNQSIAVKTGTAQIANLKGGGYLKGNNNYIFSVVGVTPAKHPRYCIYITVKQPRRMSKPAEVILSSIFKPVMNRTILMSKNGLSSSTMIKIPDLTGLSYKEAETIAQQVGFRLVRIGSGDKITKQSYQAGQKQQSGKLMLVRTAGIIKCPAMKGWIK